MQTFTAIQAACVEHVRKNITELIFSPDKMLTPTWASVQTKKQREFGRGHIVPVQTARGDAVGPVFATVRARAVADATGARNEYARFVVTQGNTIDGMAVYKRKAIKEAMATGNPVEVRKLVTSELDGVMETQRQRLMYAFAGKGWGKAATISAAPTSTTVTIPLRAAARIPLYSNLQAAQHEHTGALRDAGTSQVTGMVEDIAAGTMTLTMSVDPTSLNWASGDTLFHAGYRENAASPTRLMPTGLGAWLPFAAPGDTLFGLTRTGRPDLFGRPVNCANYGDIINALIDTGDLALEMGHQWDYVALSGKSFSALTASKERQKLSDWSGKIGHYGIGVDGFSIMIGGKKTPILRDITLEDGQFRAGPWDDEKKGPYMVLDQGDEIVNIDEFDGNKMLRLSDDTAYETRIYSDIQFVVPCPREYTAGYGLPTA